MAKDNTGVDNTGNRNSGDHTDLSELREVWKERIAKFTDDYIDEWTAKGNDLTELHRIQDELIGEILDSFQEYAQPPVVADEELDEILDKFTCSEHVLPVDRCIGCDPKAALLQREQRLVAEARVELEAEGWMYVPPSYRDTIKNYVDSARESRISLAQLRHNTNKWTN